VKRLADALQRRRETGLYRSRLVSESPAGPVQVIDGRPVIAFCSNDYLGLANDIEVNRAFRRGIEHWGSGSGAAHLINGHSTAHHALEDELAEFTGRERALRHFSLDF
jgi:8-amino-7-oxononanoate synthase